MQNTRTPKDVYGEIEGEREKEGSKQNWFKLDDAQSGVNLVSRLDLIGSVFRKTGEDLRNFYIQYGAALMMPSTSTCRVLQRRSRFSVRRSKFSSRFVEYYIDPYSKWGRRSWEVVVIDLYFLCHKGGICSPYLQKRANQKKNQKLPLMKFAMTSSVHYEAVSPVWLARIASLFFYYFKKSVLIA